MKVLSSCALMESRFELVCTAKGCNTIYIYIYITHVYIALVFKLKTNYAYSASVIHFNFQYIIDIYPLAWFNIKIKSNYVYL